MRSTVFFQIIVGGLTLAVNAASLQNRAAACALQPAGAGPKPDPDTAAAFVASSAISGAAIAALTPNGYVQQYTNLKGASIVNNQFLGVAFLKSYDVDTCAAKCNALRGCNSFNLYMERDPSLDPGSGNSGCANPASTTNIKCAFFAGPIIAATATNKGQFRNKFQVVIAGSNGYTNALYLVNQARSEIGQPSNSAQPYCSSILGYTTPILTTTIITTSTPLATTTAIGTQTDLTIATQIDASTSTSTNVVVTTTTLVVPTTQTNTQLDVTTVTSTTSASTTLFQTTTVSTTTVSIPTTTVVTSTFTAAPGAFSKRDISLPSVLSKYPVTIVSSACSLAVSSVTKTSTVTSVSITTISSTAFATQVTSTTTTTTATITSSTTVGVVETTSTTASEFTTTTLFVATTITNTNVIPESVTITSTSIVDEVATSTLVPTITSTAITTTTTVPTCTATNYRFQILGNANFNGQSLTAPDPSPPTANGAAWSALRVVSDANAGRTYTVNSDGRISAVNAVGDYTYYWVNAGSPRISFGPIKVSYNPIFCSVGSSADPAISALSPGGTLTCRSNTGVALTLGVCPGTINTLVMTTTTLPNGCNTVTLAAIPMGSAC